MGQQRDQCPVSNGLPRTKTVNPLSQLFLDGLVTQTQTPLVLSNNGSGIVEHSERFRPGTPVAIYGGGQLGITEDGLQQQWALVEDKRLLPLPAGFSLDEAAALPINYITAYQALTCIDQGMQLVSAVRPQGTVVCIGFISGITAPLAGTYGQWPETHRG